MEIAPLAITDTNIRPGFSVRCCLWISHMIVNIYSMLKGANLICIVSQDDFIISCCQSAYYGVYNTVMLGYCLWLGKFEGTFTQWNICFASTDKINTPDALYWDLLMINLVLIVYFSYLYIDELDCQCYAGCNVLLNANVSEWWKCLFCWGLWRLWSCFLN